MAHVAKFTRGTSGLLTRHYERYKDSEHPEYVKYKNQDIDPERTHLNYNLAPMRQQLPYLKERLEEVHCLKRDDVNVMCDWVVTAPKELPAEYQREFFEVCYKYLEEKYGEKNVISAYVHMDEHQPHMHFAFVPVVYDAKKDREKVSAKELLSRAELKRFHPDLQGIIDNWICEKEYDFECNVLNGATENGNKTIEELKLQNIIELRKEEEAIRDKAIKEADDKLEKINSEKDKAEGSLKTFQKDIDAREIYLGVLNSPEIEKIQSRARDNVMSKLQGKDEVIIPRSDYISLLRTAKLFEELKRKFTRMLESVKKKRLAADKYYVEKVEEAKAEVKEVKWKSIAEVKEQMAKERELKSYQNMEKLFPDVFREMRSRIEHAKDKSVSHNRDSLER